MSDELKVSDPDCNLVNVFAMINRVDEKINNFDQKLGAHMNDETIQYKRLEEKIDRLSDTVESLTVLFDAFPDTEDGSSKDIHGHKHYHVGVMRDRRESQSRWDKIKVDLMSKVLTAVLTGVAVIFALGIHTWLGAK